MKLCPQCDSGYPDSYATCPTHGGMLGEIRDLRPGMLVHNTYRIVRKLGRGGMGAVYLAQHTLMDEPQALKFLSSELSQDEAFTNRFLREVRTLHQLRHKNVVDAGNLEPAEDGTLFFPMEFVDGPDLANFMRAAQQPFDVRLALSIARGIAEGLGAAHAKGMVHRDIKPENILMARDPAAQDGERWIPKIADFGIVATRELSKYTLTGFALLTHFYAAPEQFRGTRAAELDGRTDFYALGGVLYEMLTGQKAFDAEDYHGWAQQHMTARPRWPSTLRADLANWKGLDALVLRLLAKDRAQRPKDTAELISLIDAVVYVPPKTRTDRAKPPQVANAPGEKPASRIPKWIWVAAAAVLVLAAIPATLFFMPKQSLQLGEAAGHLKAYFVGASLYKLACAGGDRDACFLLGIIYRDGRIFKRDDSKAAASFTKACDGGIVDSTVQRACDELKNRPERPPSAVPNPAQNAASLTNENSEQAAQQASSNAIAQQAIALYNQKQYAEAAPLLDQACTAGVSEACGDLGWMYKNQLGVRQDFSRALSLFTKGCDEANSTVCTDLAYMYHEAMGVAQDYRRSATVFAKACDAGSSFGCAYLGEAYWTGHGVNRDLDKAKQLYNEACSRGFESACHGLKKLD